MTLGAAGALAQDAPQSLPTIPLTAGLYNIKVEVARTPREHAIGLMWRESMPANEGMLFIFPNAGVQCFWMKNTLIPLAAAFVDDEGRIVNVVEMQPRSEASHCSARPVRFVLEMNKGWFTKKGLKAGDRLSGPPFQAPR